MRFLCGGNTVAEVTQPRQLLISTQNDPGQVPLSAMPRQSNDARAAMPITLLRYPARLSILALVELLRLPPNG